MFLRRFVWAMGGHLITLMCSSFPLGVERENLSNLFSSYFDIFKIFLGLSLIVLLVIILYFLLLIDFNLCFDIFRWTHIGLWIVTRLIIQKKLSSKFGLSHSKKEKSCPHLFFKPLERKELESNLYLLIYILLILSMYLLRSFNRSI